MKVTPVAEGQASAGCFAAARGKRQARYMETSDMTRALVKEEARRLIEKLPDSATWDDPIREIYVRQAIEHGLADSHGGRTRDVREIRNKHGLSE